MSSEEKVIEGTSIKDSGARRQFAGGAVRDMSNDKGRMDLLPLDIVYEWANIYDGLIWKIEKEKYVFSSKTLFKYISRFVSENTDNDLYTLLSIFASVAFKDISTALIEVSIHYQQGSIKYAERNWQKSLPTSSFLDSAMRHACKYLRGDKDERHDRAFIWNILGLLWTKKHHPEVDNIFYGDNYSGKYIDEFNEKWNPKDDKEENINT